MRSRREKPDDDSVADLRERLEVLAAFTRGILFEFDREGHYLRVWTGQEELLARPATELVGRKVGEVVDAEAGVRFHEAFREVYDTGQPTSFEYTLDVPAGRKTFSCEARAHDAAGGRRTVMLLVRDVTAAKELEAKLVQAEKLAALGLLAASVGHEIRQPLSYLITSVEVLERELHAGSVPPNPARTTDMLDKVRVGAARIAEIVATLDLLANQRRRETSTFDVRRPMRAALELCASELRSPLVLDLRMEETLPVRGDEGELTQVFANLLLNAAQAIPRGEESDRAAVVTVVCERRDACVRVAVSDTGTGIPPEHRERIFDPFFTTKEPGRGTGLGLFISQNIVAAHGGSFDVATGPLGTTVAIELPPAPASARVREAPPPPTRPPPVDVAAPRRLRILVVDDEPRFLESLRLALDGVHEVTTELDATSAVRRLTSDPQAFDVVLCDLSMPGVDGPELYARMKALGVADRFVLMTGGAYTKRASEFLASSACAQIGKPFLLDELLAVLERVASAASAAVVSPGRSAS